MLLFIRKSIRKGVKVTYTEDPDILGITLKKDFFNMPEDVLIWFVYASPANSPYYAKSKENTVFKLEQKLALGTAGRQLIMGDLNGRTGEVDDFIREDNDHHSPAQEASMYIPDTPMPRKNSDKNPPDEHGKMIINFCKSLQMRILNGRTAGDRWGVPTRFPMHRSEKPSLIDYGIGSIRLVQAVRSFFVSPFTTLSDHCCISVSISCNFDADSTQEETEHKTKPTSHYGFQLAKTETYRTHLRHDKRFEDLNLTIRRRITDKNKALSQEEVDEWVKTFNSCINDGAKKAFTDKRPPPKRKSKNKTKSAKWYNEACKQSKNRLKRSANLLNRDPFNRGRQEEFIAARKKHKKACKAAETDYRKHLLDKLLNADDPKEFWKTMKNMRGWGREIEDPSMCIAPSTWTEYFSKLLNSSKETPPPSKDKMRRPAVATMNPTAGIAAMATNNQPNNCLNTKKNDTTTITFQTKLTQSKVTLKELVEALSRMKIGKAVGPDGIFIEYLKYATQNVINTMLELINSLFLNALYPTAWTNNFLKAIYKTGPTDDPGNYRGLAIGSAMAKLYSTILLRRLEDYILDKGILTKNQIGFVRGFRTADHIFVLKTLITKYTQNNGRLYAAFIDFKKAYDTVNRETLLENLKVYGINGRMWENISAIYKTVQYSIKIGNRAMDPISSNLGLKQGCPLSPILFNLYINNIADYLTSKPEDSVTLQDNNISHFLYADDLVIVSSCKEGLQNQLDSLSQFADSKDLTVNTKKSQVMIFNKSGKKLKKEKFTIKGTQLEVVSKYTYLGVDIPTSGSFSTSIAELTNKAKKAMMPLFNTIMKFNIPFGKALKLFQTYIEPILLYNAENQTTMSDRDIEKCRMDRNHIYTIASESPLTRTQLKFTKFVMGVGKHCPNMTIFGESASLPLLTRAQIHMMKFWDRIKNMHENTLVNMAYRENLALNSNWCKTIQTLNSTYNLHARQHEPKDFPSMVKKLVKTDFINHWKSRISNPSLEKKLSLYSKIKREFAIEPYTKLPFKDRQIIAKILCTSHKLKVETGRHQDIPREERICCLCTLNKVEDEDHFIAECCAYDQIRLKHFGRKKLSNAEEMIAQEDPSILASFLRESYTLRENLMEEPSVEKYHIHQKKGLKLTIRKGPKVGRVQNITKDGLKIRITQS